MYIDVYIYMLLFYEYFVYQQPTNQPPSKLKMKQGDGQQARDGGVPRGGDVGHAHPPRAHEVRYIIFYDIILYMYMYIILCYISYKNTHIYTHMYTCK